MANHYNQWMAYTSTRESPYSRLRTEQARTCFFEGREFRTYKELNIASSTTYVVKVIIPVNILLYGLQLPIDSGWLRLSAHSGGTEGGTFAEALPIMAVNGMDPGEDLRSDYGPNKNEIYTKQMKLYAGGTHTGGTELDVIRIKTASITNQSISVGDAGMAETGVSPGTYYFRFQNVGSDPVTGVFRIRWEEKP